VDPSGVVMRMYGPDAGCCDSNVSGNRERLPIDDDAQMSMNVFGWEQNNIYAGC
jgi:hypothetical protein